MDCWNSFEVYDSVCINYCSAGASDFRVEFEGLENEKNIFKMALLERCCKNCTLFFQKITFWKIMFMKMREHVCRAVLQ